MEETAEIGSQYADVALIIKRRLRQTWPWLACAMLRLRMV